ncbi:hypothetical protein EPD60_04440 [Flaviaesturariibacter flavus]|uniref:PKD domain-containing protein n=1 Tax=Flaviaesturariibacter flavus TaxID=2502780 RepID=A0A4R1BJB0_9BACT|nr:hypothetical protein [Flaviaesturariibacter flavus]TCJ17445.1 hypothetical protein EPD60_04440 [Flaviaesturariibacter flavus]
MRKSFLLLAIPVVTFFVSCSKPAVSNDDDEPASTGSRVCDSLRANRITGNNNALVGDYVTLRIREQIFANDFVYINWWGPGNYSDQGHSSISFSNVNLGTSGWYHVRLSSMNQGCEKEDSVYVNVGLPQGTPSCNLALNTISYSNMGTAPITTVTKTFNSLNLRVLRAGSSSGSIELQFHPYFRDKEPIDGIYEVSTNPAQNDFLANSIYISSVAQSIFFQGNNEQQKIYISHVNGKLQAQFCNIAMSGSNGWSWTTAVSGTLREL